ncbi:MAG TPA: amidohydrolase family protein, partial [Verrucomicrobiae bacterium]|nr:amidohydrolase family protein [Verrucomicrobiae bacterium]
MNLRARIVYPLAGPPIDNGVVTVEGNRIKSVCKHARRRLKREIDLGDVVLMPGLVNAHCHLDYTHMVGQFPSPRRFTDWLKLITSTKADWTAVEYMDSWRRGAEMLVLTGTTTVADIEAVPQLLPAVWDTTPLRVISLLEMIGITQRRPPETVLQEAVEKISSLTHPRCEAGLSPHAPYSTVPALLEKTAKAARRKNWLVCIHVAESKTEFEMFKRGRGEMFEWLLKSGREMSDCGRGSPVRHLERCGLLNSRVIATHANYLAPGDALVLAQNQVSVVHCPRSHQYFEHEAFPLKRLLRAGVNMCLGTDSLASVVQPRRQPVQLDMFAE